MRVKLLITAALLALPLAGALAQSTRDLNGGWNSVVPGTDSYRRETQERERWDRSVNTAQPAPSSSMPQTLQQGGAALYQRGYR